MRRRVLAVLAVAILAVLGGCGGDGDDTTGPAAVAAQLIVSAASSLQDAFTEYAEVVPRR